MHALLQALLDLGHDCEAVATIQPGPRRLLYRVIRRLSGRRAFGLKDRRNGYPTYRAWNEFVPLLLGERLEANRPDLVVADFSSENPILPEALARTDSDSASHLHDVAGGTTDWHSARSIPSGLQQLRLHGVARPCPVRN